MHHPRHAHSGAGCASRTSLRSRPRPARPTTRADARGIATIELALVLSVLVAVLLATVDLARWTLATAALHEAARIGARVAAVCDPQDSAALDAARARLAPWALVGPRLHLAYEPAGCSATTCTRVRLEADGAALPTISPWWASTLPLPAAWVEIPREGLQSTINARSNPACQ